MVDQKAPPRSGDEHGKPRWAGSSFRTFSKVFLLTSSCDIPLDNSGCLCPWKARFHSVSTRFAQRKMVIKPQNLKCMPVFVSWIYTIEVSLNGGNVGVKMNERTFLLYFEYKICILLVGGWYSVPTGDSQIMTLNVS